MKKMTGILAMMSLDLALGGCVALEDHEHELLDPEKGLIQGFKNEPDIDLPDEIADDGEISPKAGVFDVGVIPAVGFGCPAGSDEIRIRMDDEDDGNGNSQGGWIGKTRSDGQSSNTLFVFCKVNGDLFRPLSDEANAFDMGDDYAVLKLGTTCPAGSQEFWRRFDNEDDGNANYKIGVINPNTSDRYGTKLFFCLFRYASSGVSTMASFPILGPQYGVFAPDAFTRGIMSGYIRTDDEDDGNANSYGVSSDALEAAERIVLPDPNVSHGATFLAFARVR
jgi:hypothetical protein